MKDSEARNYLIEFIDGTKEMMLTDVFIDTTDELVIEFTRLYEVVAVVNKAMIKFVLEVGNNAD